MKKIIYVAIAAILCSCAKEMDEELIPQDLSAPQAAISFVTEENTDLTRTFFDASATTETWEKSLTSLTVFCFGEDGNLLIRRNFTLDELSAKASTFPLPRTSAGKSVEFYAIANTGVDASVSTKTALLALTENDPAQYNGTFADVSTKGVRANGFLMSGSATKTVAAAGETTQVAIALKRNVAKVAVQTSLSADFAAKYPGTVKINTAKITKAAMQTPFFTTTPKTGAMTFTHTQNCGVTAGKFNSLFYLFENGALTAGSRVTLTLEGVYDRDNNFSTTADQIPVTYALELAGSSNNGSIMRNGYYRVAISLTGLTGQDVAATITVAEWQTPTTQTINLGK